MNEYTSMMIARTEHELMVRSLPPVSEYEPAEQADKPRWVSAQAGQLLYAVGSGLAALGERLKDGQRAALESALAGREHHRLSS